MNVYMYNPHKTSSGLYSIFLQYMSIDLTNAQFYMSVLLSVKSDNFLA